MSEGDSLTLKSLLFPLPHSATQSKSCQSGSWPYQEEDQVRLHPGHLFLLARVLGTKGFPGGSVVKNPPANARDTSSIPGSGRSLGGGNATHSSILAWKIPWIEEPGRLQSIGQQRVRHDWAHMYLWLLSTCEPWNKEIERERLCTELIIGTCYGN